MTKLNKYEIKNYTVNFEDKLYSVLMCEGDFPYAEKFEFISKKSKEGTNDYNLQFDIKVNKFILANIYCNEANKIEIAGILPNNISGKSVYYNLNILLRDCTVCLVSNKIDFIKEDYPFDSPLNYVDIKYITISQDGEVLIIDLSETFDELRNSMSKNNLDLISEAYKELLNNTPYKKEIETILPFEDFYGYSRLKKQFN